jgi:hypothetical protein
MSPGWAAIAASDCELIRSGLIAQPINTGTSVAYGVAGVLIVRGRRRFHLDRSAIVFGSLVALESVGSVAFHAFTNPPGRWLHDTALVGGLGFVAGHQVARLLHRPAGPPATYVGVGAFGLGGIVLVWWTDATNVLVAVLVVIALTARGLERVRAPRPFSRRTTSLLALSGVTVAAFLLGRTGSPACRPRSWFQFHGLWHVLTAAVAAAWAIDALGPAGRSASQPR